MSTAPEASWVRFIENLPEHVSVDALIRALDWLGLLDGLKQAVLAEAAEELRADVPARAGGKLGQAVALIEAGEAKQRVLAAGISRRTYFRARKKCQQCQAPMSRSSV